MHKWFVSGVVAAVAALTGALVMVSPIYAANVPLSTAGSGGSPGQGLEISPPVIELSANPGQTVTVNISVRDVTNGELIAHGEADDFGAGTGEDGQPQLLLNENGENRYSLKQWISSVPDMDLQPQQLKSNTLTIRVPADAEPGGHYGVVRFTALPPNLKGTGVALSASVGTLILLRVNGTVTDNLSLVQYAAGINNDKAGTFKVSRFFEHGPIDFLLRLHNGGTVHEQPTGTITVKNMFGRTVGTMAINSKAKNVLPDSIRRFNETLSSTRLFGYYSAKFSLKYAGNKTLEGNVSFWVIPWKLILVVVVVLVVLFIALKWLLHRYNEHIIARARQSK